MSIINTTRQNKIALLLICLLINAGSIPLLCRGGLAQAGELNFKVYNSDQSSADQSATNGKGYASAGSSNQSSAAPGAHLSAESAVNDNSASNDGSASSKSAAPGNDNDQSNANHMSAAASGDETFAGNKPADNSANENNGKSNQESAVNAEANDSGDADKNANHESSSKVLQGYVRIVPTGTKIPIVMDTAVDSDTSQEGDEFSARTVEDLTIDGSTVVPAGSIIRGRIAALNAPKHLNRSGSVALKFDTVTTPDNRQIPLVANLVARGGVVHARRGMKDIAIDTATFSLPTLVALGIGAVAGHSSSSVGIGGGALIGAGVGAAVGLAILLAKKGKKVDVRPGDELKIELAEDLHMPTM